jgi:hypothetical protein
MHNRSSIYIYIYDEKFMVSIWNIGLHVIVYNIRLHKRIENKERDHLEAHYQKELEDVKNNTARITSLLEQLLWV